MKVISPHFLFLGLQALIAENTPQTDDGAFICLICNSILKTTTTRNKHFRDVHWAEAPSYVCPEDHLKNCKDNLKKCKKMYTSKAAFRTHLRSNHHLRTCKKMYTSKAAFEMHLRRNHPEWRGVAVTTFIQKWHYMHVLNKRRRLNKTHWTEMLWVIIGHPKQRYFNKEKSHSTSSSSF